MQIALTKKLAAAMGIVPAVNTASVDPLFAWTANWVRVWENRKDEDMLVLVNNATRFVVALYEVRRRDLKNAPEKMTVAIRNTLTALYLNPEIIEEYMQMAGEVTLTPNTDRQITAWVNNAGQSCALYVGDQYNGAPKMFSDTVGAWVNHRPVGCARNYEDSFLPKEKFFAALAKITGKPIYKYRACELICTLDLEGYKAVRKLIVPADIKLPDFHRTLQSAFGWSNSHLHDWQVFKGKKAGPIARLVMTDEDLEYDEDAILETERRLSDYFPENKYILYTYDMGDNWEHWIECARVIEGYNAESPYLIEATGKTPPEDVGGVGGFVNFLEILANPNHEDYQEMKEWAGYWQNELSEWESQPRLIFVL